MHTRLLHSIINTAILILALSTVLTAQARIVRSGGDVRGTDSFNLTVYLTDEININEIGYDYNGGNLYDSFSYNSYHDYVYATPSDSCHFDVNYDPVSNQDYRTDCDYEFDLGERLQLEGDIEVFLQGTARYDLVWTISQGAQSWQYAFLDMDASNGVLSQHLFLDVAMPTDMAVGDYNVTLDFTQYAAPTQVYFSYSAYTDPAVCAVLGPVGTPETCGQLGSSSPGLSFFSNTEQLRVLANIPEPGVFYLILFGAFGLRSRIIQN
ncbi:hypothetical protein [Neptunicella sp. SCSIO 80796]|uniref:hypothetical protein n=1 Tax=Neptunicella plasticusilytica TaxID=3117012 RepID=UPI003A4D8A96